MVGFCHGGNLLGNHHGDDDDDYDDADDDDAPEFLALIINHDDGIDNENRFDTYHNKQYCKPCKFRQQFL